MPQGFEGDWASAFHDRAVQDQILRASFSPKFKLHFAAITQRANQGDRQAQITLALIYDYGAVMYKNPQEAFRWYRKAAAQGYQQAQTKLDGLDDLDDWPLPLPWPFPWPDDE